MVGSNTAVAVVVGLGEQENREQDGVGVTGA